MGCRAADYTINMLRQRPGAPPFIGLIPLDDEARERAEARTREFLGGRTERLGELFRKFPSVSMWLVAHCLSETYGDDDHAVYPHIEDVLGVRLETHPQRTALFDSFCGACEKFGLPTRGLERKVDLYLLHAGVSEAQVEHVIDAFLRQEAAFGPAPAEMSALLNRWEDEALDFVSQSVSVPRRPIQWDETGWHAALFARLREGSDGFEPAIEFERHFKEVFDRLSKEGRLHSGAGRGESFAPQPRLAWLSGELALRLPRSEGRIRLWLDGAQQPLRLRGGEDWTLPQPWPRRMQWEVAGQAGQHDLLDHEGCAAFDRITGHLITDNLLAKADQSELELDSIDTVLLSRSPFSINGEPALESGSGSHVGLVGLRREPAVLDFGGREILLKARPRRRLSLAGDELARGPDGPLHGPSATLRVETGFSRSETRALRVTVGEEERFVEARISEEGFGEITIEELLEGFPESVVTDPLRIRVELMAPSVDGSDVRTGSGIKMAAWVWPGLRRFDGWAFESERPPRNLVRGESHHVEVDDQGHLCLDRHGGYSAARAVFEIDGKHVSFDLRWPDVTVVRRRADGAASPLPLGARLSVSEDDRFDTICIRCPDPKAELTVRGRREARPFFGGLTRNLAMRDLLEPADDERVLLRRGNGSEALLFELVSALAPRRVEFLPAGRAVRLRIDFDEPVDAVAVEIEDEFGEATLEKAALRHRPVESRRPDWLRAEVCDDDAHAIELTLDADWLDGDTRLARLLIRPEGSDAWRPLRNARGDGFAVVLADQGQGEATSPDGLSRRFETLCRWLSDCYAEECWGELGRVLESRWEELGRALHDAHGGDGVVMRAAALPPPDHASAGWVPVLHPLRFLPSLYAAPPLAFSSLAVSDDPGVKELAALSTLNTARLRELAHLHPTVYLAFRNLWEATNSGEPLKGFDPPLFFGNLPLVDGDPSAGWFWRGTPLLGPDHWRAAHLRLVERFEAANLFADDAADEGPNSLRQTDLHRLLHAAWALTPEELRPPAPLRSVNDEEPKQVDLWASALLSGFARASRFDEVTDYVDSLSQRTATGAGKALTSLAFLLRLAPELFAFHLLLWEIAKERP